MLLQQTLAQRLMKAVIILAAGNGTRMRSSVPKVLHTISGKPMLQWVIDEANYLEFDQTIIVASPTLELEGKSDNIDIVVQEIPLGTGHALQIAFSKVKSSIKQVLMICGDTPLLDHNELKHLIESKADLTLTAMKIDDLSKSYGRIILDANGYPTAIVETKHNEKAKENNIANAGAYAFSRDMLQALLPQLKPNPEANEIYATDLLELAVAQKYSRNLVYVNEENFLGVNTLIELVQAEKIMQNRIKKQHMLNGVRFILPDTTYVNYDAEIENDVYIEPNVYIGPRVRIAEKVCILGASYLSDCLIYQDASVGPFAHLRGKVVVQEGASIGNFVEVKNSQIGKNAKAKHLSYIGDAIVGDKANIGAGTITCNYNGFEKFKTQIGKGVMVGVNTTLIAPVHIGDGSYIAAGSVITEDVPNDSLAIARVQQHEKNGWAMSFRAKYTKKLS